MNISPLLISLKIATVSLVFTFTLGILAALKMHFYKGRFKNVIDSFINLPIVLPPVVTGFLLLLLFGKNGALGKLLGAIDVNLIFSWQAGVVASIVITFPLMYRSVLSSLHYVDSELIDVARSFGATNVQTFSHVIFPLCLPGIISGTILAFTRSLGEFGATLMIAGNIPNKTQTIPSAIYFYASGGDYDTALVWVLVIILISFCFMSAANRIIKTA